MKKVMVFGVFDILHLGHINLMKQAKKYGDFLIVVVARDKNVKKIKNKPAYHNEDERKEILEQIKLADKVVLGDENDSYKVIKKEKPDVICLGYDQSFFVDGLENFLKSQKMDTKIVWAKPFGENKYKSSKLKQSL